MEDEMSLLDLVAVMLRQRWTIMTFVIVVAGLFAGGTLVMPRDWTATTSFMPQAAANGLPSRLSSLAGQFGLDLGGSEGSESPQFYSELVRSREILGKVAGDTFDVGDTVGWFAKGRRRGTLAEVVGLKGERPELRQAGAVKWLREKAVSVAADGETGIVTVSVTTRWPDLSGGITGRIVALVNKFNLETRQSQASAERRFVEERMDAARGDLRAAENKFQDFLQNNRAFQNSPQLAFQHDRLQREVVMRQELYTSLAQSYEQARIAEVRDTPVITVLERPEIPVRPEPRHLVLKAILGVLMGALAGIMVAFGRDYLRRQREGASEDLDEISALWEETRGDFRRFTRILRPSRRY